MEKFLNFKNPTLTEAISRIENGLGKYIPQQLVYVYLDSDTPKNRLILRNYIQQNDALNIVLVSGNKNLAELAWIANVYHFLYLQSTDLLPAFSLLKDRLMSKYNEKEIPKKLKIPFKGGMDVIDLHEICFCTGEGNYTTIYLSSGIKKTVTLRLNVIEKSLCTAPNFQRIGKSFIINLNKISKIKDKTVELSTAKDPLKLNLSDLYIKRLKKTIMWY